MNEPFRRSLVETWKSNSILAQFCARNVVPKTPKALRLEVAVSPKGIYLEKRMKTVVFDLDRTLADDSRRVHHIQVAPGEKKDWDAYYADQENDPVIEHMAILLDMYQRADYFIVILTAREDIWEAVTCQWLLHNVAHYDTVIMRPKGDRTNDAVYKVRALNDLVAQGHDIEVFFEDRTRIVEMARAWGFNVLQVAEGDY